jgi:hypothetical protein
MTHLLPEGLEAKPSGDRRGGMLTGLVTLDGERETAGGRMKLCGPRWAHARVRRDGAGQGQGV